MDHAADLVLARPSRLGAVRLAAVDGPSGSGKTTFAAALAAEIGHRGRFTVTVLGTDLLATFDEPFSFWPAIADGVLAPLGAGSAGSLRVNDWSTGAPQPGEIRSIEVPDVLIIEGVSSGRRSVANLLTALIWVELPDRQARLERAVSRDGGQFRRQYLTWQDREDAFFAADGTPSRSDLLVNPTNWT